MKHPKVFSNLWLTEKGLSSMLVFLVLVVFVGAPFVAMGVVGEGLLDLFFVLLLVSGVMAISHRRALTVFVATLILSTLAVRLAGWGRGPAEFPWDSILSGLSLAVLAVLVLGQVFREGPITFHRIQGAIAVYLLLGLIFAQAYEVILRVLPAAFSFARPVTTLQAHELAYFSFVTLTTVGYGDITPIHPIARSLAVGEALVGQLYPAILIARLVSLEIISRTERKH